MTITPDEVTKAVEEKLDKDDNPIIKDFKIAGDNSAVFKLSIWDEDKFTPFYAKRQENGQIIFKPVPAQLADYIW